MAIQAQSETQMRWMRAGWTPVVFPNPPKDQIIIGGGPVFLVNSAKDLIFIDHEGNSFEIEPFMKEFVKVEVRDASVSRSDTPLLHEDKQGKFDF